VHTPELSLGLCSGAQTPPLDGKLMPKSVSKNLEFWPGGATGAVDSVNQRGDGYRGGLSKLFPVDSEGCSHGVRVARDPSLSSSGHGHPKVLGSRPQNPQT
jgi:hypothetical protein